MCVTACILMLSVVQNYFTRVLEDDLKAVIKPQYVDHIPKAVRGNVGEVLTGKDQRGIKDYLLQKLDLEQVGSGARACQTSPLSHHHKRCGGFSSVVK